MFTESKKLLIYCLLNISFTLFPFLEQPADFVLQLKSVAINEYENAEFTVKLTKPNVPLKWTKNGVEVTANEKFSISSQDVTYNLAIASCELVEGGQYACVLPSGKSSKADLKVKGI